MKINLKKLLIQLAIPLATGGIATLLSGGMDTYKTVNQPPLSPPGWVFPIVWTILYLMMGYAAYRVITGDAPKENRKKAMLFYSIQLFLNFLWPILFFRFETFWLAFFVLLALWVFIYLTMHLFSQIDETAESLLIPYLLWVTFAGYLNLGVALLN